MNAVDQVIIKQCYRHGSSQYVYEPSSQRYRCRKCRSENACKRINKERSQLKFLLLAAKGSECNSCGYSSCSAALDFHHINKLKERNLSYYIARRNKQKALEEIVNCIILCKNCHREHHADNLSKQSVDYYRCSEHQMHWQNNTCQECRSLYVKRARRELKEQLVLFKGGKCQGCFKLFPYYIYEFHHVEPSNKIENVSKFVADLAYIKAFDEARKCILLCPNCHSEEEKRLRAKIKLAKVAHWTLTEDTDYSLTALQRTLSPARKTIYLDAQTLLHLLEIQTPAEIAKEFNCRVGRIQSLIRQHKLQYQHPYLLPSKEFRDPVLIEGLLDKGLSAEQIATEFGVTSKTVRKWIRYHGLASPQKRGVYRRQVDNK